MVGKYRNVRTNGYASKREAKRAQELRLLERAGKISRLETQVKFLLVPQCGKERPVHYVADFVYQDQHGIRVVEDCKGFRTDVYKLKRKLMKWVRGIEILET